MSRPVRDVLPEGVRMCLEAWNASSPHLVDLHVSRVAGRVRRFEARGASTELNHPAPLLDALEIRRKEGLSDVPPFRLRVYKAPDALPAPERDLVNEAKVDATRRFGPGELIMAHVHDGDHWSEHEMVVWLPPEGEFGR